MDEAKLKRWGWGAVIGLAAVILIAGLVVAISTSAPKPKANDSTTTAKVESDKKDKNKKDDKKSESKDDEKKETVIGSETDKNSSSNNGSNNGGLNLGLNYGSNNGSNSSSNSSASDNAAATMPKTGPVDSLIVVLGASATAYLAALNFGLMKKKEA